MGLGKHCWLVSRDVRGCGATRVLRRLIVMPMSRKRKGAWLGGRCLSSGLEV